MAAPRKFRQPLLPRQTSMKTQGSERERERGERNREGSLIDKVVSLRRQQRTFSTVSRARRKAETPCRSASVTNQRGGGRSRGLGALLATSSAHRKIGSPGEGEVEEQKKVSLLRRSEE